MDSLDIHGWLLYAGKEIREVTRFREEAAKTGIHLEVVDPADVELLLDGMEPARIFQRGVAATLPMYVIAALGETGDLSYNLALLQQLETQGVLCVNRADTMKKTIDKLLCLQLLAARNVPVPRTILVHRGTSPAFIIEQFGLPVVVKVIDGWKGHGVVLVRSEKELENLLEMRDAARCPTQLLAQEFIADSRGRDVRVLIVDGKPRVSGMRFNHSPEGFKSNIAAGGSAEAFPMTDAIRDLSARVAEILGLDMGGVDLLFHGEGFVVGEANSVPGFVGTETRYGINVAGEILQGIRRRLGERAEIRAADLIRNFRSIDDICGIKDPGLIRFFADTCARIEETQHAVLMDILRRNAGTEFGKAHGFELISSVEEFRQQVPVSGWEAFQPYSERMELGEESLLFTGRPKHFISTSGTLGHLKLIPESAEGDRVKALVTHLRLLMSGLMAPGIRECLLVPLVNTAEIGRTAGGIPYGYASGLALAGLSPEVRRRVAFPPEVLQAADAETLDYLIMRYALAQPLVAMLLGNNPGRITSLLATADRHRESLIADIDRGILAEELKIEPALRTILEKDLKPDPERAQALRKMIADRGRLEPRDYWPDLKIILCWLGGTIGRYVEALKPWLPESVVFFDIGYGASEGKLNVPQTPGVSEGPLAAFGCFFEFVPLSGGEPLLAHELKDGEEYLILITTYSGLYRYDLHDIVQVRGFSGQNPNIQFIGKAGEIAGLAGEKLTGAFLSEVIRQTLNTRNIGWRHFCVVADSDHHRYDFYIEPEGTEHPDSAWISDVDRVLCKQSPTYDVVRRQHLVDFPRLIIMKQGWLDRLYADRMGPSATMAQIKLPVICREAPPAELIEKIVGD